jgi:hypothetical protein
VTLIWITEEDRRRSAEIRREQIERAQLLMLFGRWLHARTGHDGPVYVPELTAETEARLLELFRQTRP